MKDNKTLIFKILLASTLVAIAVTWRIINHNYSFAPNLELVTVGAVLAAIALGASWAIIVPLAAIIISDLIIGNSSIFIFTWGSFALIGAGSILLAKLNKQPKKQLLASAGFAVAGSFTFFIITNLGVWLQGWYPATIAGLTACFTLAIPFYRTMLIGNLIIVPVSVSIYQLVRAKIVAKNLVIDSSVS
jgi:hypothetical protein